MPASRCILCVNREITVSSVKYSTKESQGAAKILGECLLLRRGDVLTVVFDETTETAASIVTDVAETLGINANRYSIALTDQRQYNSDSVLPEQLLQYLDESRGVLTCLASDPASTTFRNNLVRRARGDHKRVGHMPGITPDLLRFSAEIDYSTVEQKCDDLALALTLGTEVELHTYPRDRNGVETDECTLHIDIGGQQRNAIVSSGVIPLNNWGNVPGGETFIAPVEGRATGRFALTGAFKDCVIPPGAALILHFVSGSLTRVEGPQWLRDRLDSLFAHAIQAGDTGWSTLAELGIGTAGGMRGLTGNSLLDEKCLGTVHIALGSNITFGGESHSRAHEDLIANGPTVWIDNKLILDHGQYVFNPIEWRDNLSTFALTPATMWQMSEYLVARGIGVRGHDNTGSLRLEIPISEGRINTYTVGDPESSPVLASVYREIPFEGVIALGALGRRIRRKRPDVDGDLLMRALGILHKHRLIILTPQ